jgi:hypothetical protein
VKLQFSFVCKYLVNAIGLYKLNLKRPFQFAGGGDKAIQVQKLDWKANSKVGSTDNMKHKPGGGRVKVKQS